MKLSLALIAAGVTIGSVSATGKHCTTQCCVNLPQGWSIQCKDQNGLIEKKNFTAMRNGQDYSVLNGRGKKVGTFHWENGGCQASPGIQKAYPHANFNEKHVYHFGSSQSSYSYRYASVDKNNGEYYGGERERTWSSPGVGGARGVRKYLHEKDAHYSKDKNNSHIDGSIEKGSYAANSHGNLPDGNGYFTADRAQREHGELYGSKGYEHEDGKGRIRHYAQGNDYNGMYGYDVQGRRNKESQSNSQYFDYTKGGRTHVEGVGRVNGEGASGYLSGSRQSGLEVGSGYGNKNSKETEWNHVRGGGVYRDGNETGGSAYDRGKTTSHNEHSGDIRYTENHDESGIIGGNIDRNGVHGAYRYDKNGNRVYEKNRYDHSDLNSDRYYGGETHTPNGSYQNNGEEHRSEAHSSWEQQRQEQRFDKGKSGTINKDVGYQ